MLSGDAVSCEIWIRISIPKPFRRAMRTGCQAGKWRSRIQVDDSFLGVGIVFPTQRQTVDRETPNRIITVGRRTYAQSGRESKSTSCGLNFIVNTPGFKRDTMILKESI